MKVAIELAIYRLEMTIGIPIINDRITFPFVAIHIKATGTTRFANSPSGIKLILGNQILKVRSIQNMIFVQALPFRNSPVIKVFIPSEIGINAPPKIPAILGSI